MDNNYHTYVCHKKVKAKRMTLTDAEVYLKKELRSPDGEEDGYLVLYDNGYESWSPKTVFENGYIDLEIIENRLYAPKELCETVELMDSTDFKERFKAEYYQTKIRYDRLHDMIVRYEAGKLNFTPKCTLDLLKEQASYMGRYLYTLEIRSYIEDVPLL